MTCLDPGKKWTLLQLTVVINLTMLHGDAGCIGRCINLVCVEAVMNGPCGKHLLPICVCDGGGIGDRIEVALRATVEEPIRFAIVHTIAINRSGAAVPETSLTRRFRTGGPMAFNRQGSVCSSSRQVFVYVLSKLVSIVLAFEMEFVLQRIGLVRKCELEVR